MGKTKEKYCRLIKMLYWLLPYLMVLPFILTISTDYFYMVVTGKYILENGIPQTNPFNAVDGLHIVIQNWTFCVLQYLCSLKIGLTGIQLLGCVEYLIFSLTCYNIAKQSGQTEREAGYFTFAANIVMASVMSAARPAILTICLILAVMDSLPSCNKGKKSIRFIVTITLSAVIVVNMQSSNLIFLLCPVAAYIAACMICNKSMQYKLCRMIPIIIGSVLAFLLSWLLNPYGMKNILYLFHSLGHVSADELGPIPLLSLYGIIEMFAIVSAVAVLCLKLYNTHWQNTDDPYHLLLLVGFGLLSVFCKRNLIFLIPALLYVWEDILMIWKHIFRRFRKMFLSKMFLSHRIVLPKSVKLVAFGIIISLWVGHIAGEIIPPGDMKSQIVNYWSDSAIIETLEKSERKISGAKVFPGDAYMQIWGMKVLIEPRNEVSDSKINQVDDLYSKYTYLSTAATKEEIDDFFNEYAFDYYLAEIGEKLDVYFSMNEKYQEIIRTESLVMYERKE